MALGIGVLNGEQNWEIKPLTYSSDPPSRDSELSETN
jgi:hypothetical protein